MEALWASTARKWTASCSRDEVGFYAVCRRAIERVIDMYVAPPKR
jgi:hypothetical protein